MGANLAYQAYKLVALVALALSALGYTTPVRAQTTDELCGNGSPPDYGLSYSLLQPHWTVGWEGYATEQAVDRVDRVFDRLDEDAIAQTMILILPQDQVGIRTNCAVHFLRYMELGLPTGARKDNGFVFLIVVEPDDIDVHYAVGLGLPALTAPELTNINRAVEDSYQSTHSMDQALLTLASEFSTAARSNYDPAPSAVVTPEVTDQPVGPAALVALCGQFCLGLLLFVFLAWMFSQLGGGGRRYYTPQSNPWQSNPWGGSSWGGSPWRSFPSRGFPSSGSRGFPSPRMRGGSGSGRSGRTN
ncbi:MAG TPA: hypothetical protein VFQ23_19025 [Anaerolineales bacterium]|nr:hypothetical protein [Anaerolineales bacterium]